MLEAKLGSWNGRDVLAYVQENSQPFCFSDYDVMAGLVNDVFGLGVTVFGCSETYQIEKLGLSDLPDWKALFRQQERQESQVVMVFYNSHFDQLEPLEAPTQRSQKRRRGGEVRQHTLPSSSLVQEYRTHSVASVVCPAYVSVLIEGSWWPAKLIRQRRECGEFLANFANGAIEFFKLEEGKWKPLLGWSPKPGLKCEYWSKSLNTWVPVTVVSLVETSGTFPQWRIRNVDGKKVVAPFDLVCWRTS